MMIEFMDERQEVDFIQDRITADPQICHGQPTIRGMRIRVMDVLEMLAGGMTPEEILADFDYLERGDISACLRYAARLASHRYVSVGRIAPQQAS